MFQTLGVEVKSAGNVWDLKTCVVHLCQSPMCFHKPVFVTLRGVLRAAKQARQLLGQHNQLGHPARVHATLCLFTPGIVEEFNLGATLQRARKHP